MCSSVFALSTAYMLPMIWVGSITDFSPGFSFGQTINFFYFFFIWFSMLRFFSLKMFLNSLWSFGNKALIEMATINFILPTIASDSNKRNSISCFLAFFNILCHLIWKSSITVSMDGVFLMRSSKWVTSFESISLKFSWWCLYLKYS